MKGPRSTAGFTLMELIMALAILVLIAGSVTAGLRIALSSMERGEAIARDAARLRAAVGILERSIRSADTLPVPDGDNTAFFFAGEERRLRFITAQAPATLGGGGPRLISFHAVSGREGGLAISAASPFRQGGPGEWEGTGDPLVLVPGAGELSFAYSGGPSEEGRWEWSSSWNAMESGRLPAAVRVEFSVLAEEGARTTAFVVPIPAGGGAGG